MFQKRTEGTLASLQAESERQRIQDQVAFINEELERSPEFRDQSFGLAQRIARKRDTESNLHRNCIKIGDAAACKKETVIIAQRCVTKQAIVQMNQDKRFHHEMYARLTEFGSCTSIGVTAMPLENFLQ